MIVLTEKDFSLSVTEEDAVTLIRKAEEDYRKIIDEICEEVERDSNKKIIMLAGPSGSGKTTTAGKIKEKLESMGHEAYTVSLDDFYKNKGEGPMNPDGTYDFESVEALDVEMIHKCFRELIENSESELPVFDFMTGRRSECTNKIYLDDDDVIIVEGLHALNPKISGALPRENLFEIYISVASRFYDEKEILLNKRNLRFIRRMVRDFQFRNSSVENTYSLWPQVMEGEDKYLFPYKDNADMIFNTTHAYEPCVFRNIATALLLEVEKDSKNYDDAQTLISALSKFPAIDKSLVPENSLLREFLGK